MQFIELMDAEEGEPRAAKTRARDAALQTLDEEKAKAWIAEQRWHGGPHCPYWCHPEWW